MSCTTTSHRLFSERGAGGATPPLYSDVTPDVLAREEASEQRRGAAASGNVWQSYLRRVLPALERRLGGEMAEALLTAGYPPAAARAQASAMRRRAMAAADVGQVRFWADVGEALAARQE